MVDSHRPAPQVSTMMTAIRLYRAGDPAALVYEQIQTPWPGPGEVLVRVHAAGVTRDELEWPAGRLPATPSYELSGVVAVTGRAVDGVTSGAEVYALCSFDRDGAAAEYVVVPQESLAAKPRTLGHLDSATIPLAGLSAWQGLFDHGQLGEGQRVLIHGAAGGVGGFAVQLAHGRGAHVIGTASTRNVQAVRESGADQVIDHTVARFEDIAGTVDLVFDTVGGDRLERSLCVLRSGGRLVSVASEPPHQAAAERGITAVYFVVEPNQRQLAELARHADRGQLHPVVDTVFPLALARQAFERSLHGNRRGKIVLRVAEEP